jgi:hypothetical protein
MRCVARHARSALHFAAQAADAQHVDSTTRNPRAARALIVAGVLAFALATAGLFARVTLATSWYYVAAWWSYILVADGVVHLRRGRSLILSTPRSALLLSIWSALFWLAFEVLNLRLENWYYVGVPKENAVIVVGAFLSFATVLPGILETRDLLEALGAFERARCKPWNVTRRGLAVCFALGCASLALPLAFPRYAYALVWGAVVLLVEPWLFRRGERGLLASLSAGDPRPALRLLVAGLVAGGLWEAWNFHAEAKWIYTVPFFDEAKVFEMPVVGFLGFPPFALSCWTFARALVALGFVPEWEGDERRVRRRAREILGALAAIALSLPAIEAMDRHTVRARYAFVDDVPWIDPRAARVLHEHGIHTPDGWRRARARGDAPALQQFDAPERARWIALADLMAIEGLADRGADWLTHAGVENVESLARAWPEQLMRAFDARADGPAPPPRLAEVEVWVRGARRALERPASR